MKDLDSNNIVVWVSTGSGSSVVLLHVGDLVILNPTFWDDVAFPDLVGTVVEVLSGTSVGVRWSDREWTLHYSPSKLIKL